MRRLGQPDWFRSPRAIGMAALVLGFFASSAGADLRVLEVVGAVPLDEEMRATGVPKDRAIEEALWEGVSRVAADLLVDSIVPEPEDGSDPVQTALGRDMVPYTRSFRIVDDQGERPSLFTEDPDAATEYVVVVEVQVEADRVRERLLAAGLIEDGLRILGGIDLEVRDLTEYRGYETLLALLVSEPVGAVSVSPTEFEYGRAKLSVEAEWGASELLERLLAAVPPTLRITPLEVSDHRAGGDGIGQAGEPPRLVVSVRFLPPPPDEE